MALAGALLAPAGPLSADSQTTARKLEAVRERIESLRESLQTDLARKGSLQSRLRDVEKDIAEVTRRLHELDAGLAHHGAELERLGREAARLRSELDAQRGRLARQIRAAYAMGRQEHVKLLLNQQDPATVSRVLTYYDYFNRARSEQIEAVTERLARLREVRRAIDETRGRLARLRSTRAEERTALEATRAKRAQVLAALQARIESKGDDLERLRADEARLERLMRRLQGMLSDIPPEVGEHKAFAGLKGELPWPTAGRLRARFGAPRQVGDLRWQGVLIAAPSGREVRAVARGRVAFADWLRGFGLLIIVDHGDGFMSLYGHNQSLYKETGNWVEGGQPIATVGASGGRDRSGLYFEIRRQGEPVDPVAWCRAARGDRIVRAP
ncbi:MAG: peptidoglycan DD-metalloendopeptidase family protein [Gammaproteobacteria bacterium]|nr:peptidoglycan DD-metalloendopeptidase family protein [Gammaproteobacteria bacterium]